MPQRLLLRPAEHPDYVYDGQDEQAREHEDLPQREPYCLQCVGNRFRIIPDLHVLFFCINCCFFGRRLLLDRSGGWAHNIPRIRVYHVHSVAGEDNGHLAAFRGYGAAQAQLNGLARGGAGYGIAVGGCELALPPS